jgi:hypothetical protein
MMMTSELNGKKVKKVTGLYDLIRFHVIYLPVCPWTGWRSESVSSYTELRVADSIQTYHRQVSPVGNTKAERGNMCSEQFCVECVGLRSTEEMKICPVDKYNVSIRVKLENNFKL